MKKMYNLSDIAVVEVREAWCDFCLEERRTLKCMGGRTIPNTTLTTQQADICFDCATQAAQILLEKAEAGEDGQIQT